MGLLNKIKSIFKKEDNITQNSEQNDPVNNKTDYTGTIPSDGKLAILHKGDLVLPKSHFNLFNDSYKNNELYRLNYLLKRTKNKRIKKKLQKRINEIRSNKKNWIVGVDLAKNYNFKINTPYNYK